MLTWKTVNGRFTIESSEKVQPDKISAPLVFHNKSLVGTWQPATALASKVAHLVYVRSTGPISSMTTHSPRSSAI
jgi:hypothetical protein